MSRSNRKEYVQNPAEFELEWAGAGDAGHFRVYDKELKDNLSIPFPVRFAVLDELSTVRGWSDDHKSNVFANEIHATKHQNLTVKVFKDGKPHEIMEGKYQDIKERLIATGAKYHKVIYATLLDPIDDLIGGGTIVKIVLKGAAMSEWVNFTGKMDGAVVVDGYKDGKKGAVRYRVPVFSKDEINPDEEIIALEHDKELQAFFKRQPHTTAEDSPSAMYTDADCPAEEDDDIPF